jgi:hypothetical protein
VSIVWGDARQSAVDRLEVYANAYFHRIHGVLAGDFPALEAALGTELFRDLVTSYLLVRPSEHPSLRYVGSGLAGFLASHGAAEGIRKRAPWAADLATFEWARGDAFDAPDRQALSRESVAAIVPERFGEIRLLLGPWIFLHRFEFPVAAIWREVSSRHAEEGTCESRSLGRCFDPSATALVIWRQDEMVFHRPLAPLEEDLLAMMSIGCCLGEVCEVLAERLSESEAPGRAAIFLEQWLAAKWLADPANTAPR